MKTHSFLTRFGILFFYLLEIPVWMFFSLPILAGADIRKPLGLLGIVAVPLYGLFILFSLGAHIFALIKPRHYNIIKPLFFSNVIGIIGFFILTLGVIFFALYH
jgi:hypothetical protein